MHKVLTEAEVVHTEAAFVTWAEDRGLNVTDELFRLVHMLLLSSDDAREALVEYITSEAAAVEAGRQRGDRS